ncbi:hypothetical protein [Methylosinus sp. Ce-a6]|uniref:hypothetical protein n=1 Tax=Methylosinus sp. Ce-a6 TaxID=2172005 RepID=UPI0019167FE5|nr:hypothetical protein [Methylosinus sp. Ce-a6]
MRFALIPLSRCAALCGLAPHEMLPGATPSPSHQSLYESYLMLCDRGADFVRDLIVADMRRALDLGARPLAAELFLVLRRFLSFPRGEPRFRGAPPDAAAIEAALGVVERLAVRRPPMGPDRHARIFSLAPLVGRCDGSAAVGGLCSARRDLRFDSARAHLR